MKLYPLLTAKQQQALPALIKPAELIPAQFDDSTHQLWHCETVDGSMVLKVCDHDDIQHSSFWQGMQQLFGVDLPAQLGDFGQVYQKITELGSLAIPDYIASNSESEDQLSPAFILARRVSGAMIDNNAIDDSIVKQLAEHISQLHQSQQTTWGSLFAATVLAKEWPQRLQNTLNYLTETQQIPKKLLAEAISLAANIVVENFVPIMVDLRWDQFLQQNGKLSALVDLDAFVYGPIELELVLLEYLLTEQQAKVFTTRYQQTHSLPDLTQVRRPYRLLLFMMNVLGEKDLDAWIQAPTRFSLFVDDKVFAN